MKTAIAILALLSSAHTKEIYRNLAEVNFGFLTHDCYGAKNEEFLEDSAIWAVERINHLQFLPIKLGLEIYKTCSEKEDFDSIFQMFLKNDEKYVFAVINNAEISQKARKFASALDLDLRETARCFQNLVQASVSLLARLGRGEQVTLLVPNEFVAQNFVKIAIDAGICLKDVIVYKLPTLPRNGTYANVVAFGTEKQLAALIENLNFSAAILAPTDGSVPKDISDDFYIITTPQNRLLNYTPNPRFFEIALPIASYALHFQTVLTNFCNDTLNKPACLKNEAHKSPYFAHLDTDKALDFFKINILKPSFNYIIYKSLNYSLIEHFSYNIFTKELLLLDSNSLEFNETVPAETQCRNFDTQFPISLVPYYSQFQIRNESWVFAFLSISLLGVVFCVAVLIFLFVAICRQSIVEGNPVLTMLLLVSVMFMYCSILPLSLEGRSQAKDAICITRALSITLSFAAAFSLMLSRGILLAAASKEIGFMSHVAGPVQSFLCLFIFGVQAALSFQALRHCDEVFQEYFFIYLLAYNAMLLLLLLCLSPLFYHSHRNYNEGKYFTLAIISICVLWAIWVPLYGVLGEQFKDPLLCFGLVSTASVLIGTVFIPRTYLMTLAAARDKLRSTLSSIPSTTAMDLYRTQPVYDCINIATINAVARSGLEIQEPDLYTCPNLEDLEIRCETPVSDNKVTRF